MKVGVGLLATDGLPVVVLVENEKVVLQLRHKIEESETVLKIFDVDPLEMNVKRMQVRVDEMQQCLFDAGYPLWCQIEQRIDEITVLGRQNLNKSLTS